MVPTLFVIFMLAVLYWFPIRQWMSRWGATPSDRVRVMAEARHESFEVLMYRHVADDFVFPTVQHLSRRQLAMENQPTGFQRSRMLRQLLDGIAAIAQNSLVAIDISDAAAA